ncbi:MAG: class III signal peptide-containing protein [Methanobrevibacter sp.]|nr:class III signal peptide-containing protein [Methanobrevibacter sp.]MBQ6627620.1 class III signal peptide-containing protein [Methanobrevibacter sp.]
MLVDNRAQASVEYILLFGGIMVVVLLAMYMYNNYVSDLSGEIASKEVKEFNGELNALGKYFK